MTGLFSQPEDVYECKIRQCWCQESSCFNTNNVSYCETRTCPGNSVYTSTIFCRRNKCNHCSNYEYDKNCYDFDDEEDYFVCTNTPQCCANRYFARQNDAFRCQNCSSNFNRTVTSFDQMKCEHDCGRRFYDSFCRPRIASVCSEFDEYCKCCNCQRVGNQCMNKCRLYDSRKVQFYPHSCNIRAQKCLTEMCPQQHRKSKIQYYESFDKRLTDLLAKGSQHSTETQCNTLFLPSGDYIYNNLKCTPSSQCDTENCMESCKCNNVIDSSKLTLINEDEEIKNTSILDNNELKDEKTILNDTPDKTVKSKHSLMTNSKPILNMLKKGSNVSRKKSGLGVKYVPSDTGKSQKNTVNRKKSKRKILNIIKSKKESSNGRNYFIYPCVMKCNKNKNVPVSKPIDGPTLFDECTSKLKAFRNKLNSRTIKDVTKYYLCHTLKKSKNSDIICDCDSPNSNSYSGSVNNECCNCKTEIKQNNLHTVNEMEELLGVVDYNSKVSIGQLESVEEHQEVNRVLDYNPDTVLDYRLQQKQQIAEKNSTTFGDISSLVSLYPHRNTDIEYPSTENACILDNQTNHKISPSNVHYDTAAMTKTLARDSSTHKSKSLRFSTLLNKSAQTVRQQNKIIPLTISQYSDSQKFRSDSSQEKPAECLNIDTGHCSSEICKKYQKRRSHKSPRKYDASKSEQVSLTSQNLGTIYSGPSEDPQSKINYYIPSGAIDSRMAYDQDLKYQSSQLESDSQHRDTSYYVPRCSKISQTGHSCITPPPLIRCPSELSRITQFEPINFSRNSCLCCHRPVILCSCNNFRNTIRSYRIYFSKPEVTAIFAIMLFSWLFTIMFIV